MLRTKKVVGVHHWVVIASVNWEWPSDLFVVEWCDQCGVIRRKKWKSRQRPRYFVQDLARPWSYPAGSDNAWLLAKPPECRSKQK